MVSRMDRDPTEPRNCPALLCENWTPGNFVSPDGPSRHIHRFCLLVEHGRGQAHKWSGPVEVNPAGAPRDRSPAG